jgi:photosystem II Psb27 protein
MAKSRTVPMKMMRTSSTPESYSSRVSKGLTENVPVFTAAAVTLLLQPMRALAEDAPAATDAAQVVKPAAPAKVELGPVPTDFGLNYKDYYGDVLKVVNHMRYAVQMEKSNPRISEVAGNVKAEMLDFVSYYRRFNGISGKQSFSLLYTSVNVLAGHYTSYGTKFPVPEKRRKRLMIEFNDIEKQVRKKR